MADHAFAFIIGPWLDAGVSLSTIFGWTAVAAAAMGALSLVVTKRSATSMVDRD